LEDGLNIFDYDVKPGDTIQAFQRVAPPAATAPSEMQPQHADIKFDIMCVKTRQHVEVLDPALNAWFEAVVVKSTFDAKSFSIRVRIFFVDLTGERFDTSSMTIKRISPHSIALNRWR
jgi:hypothetical protein